MFSVLLFSPDAVDEQRVRSDQLLLTNPVAFGGSIRGRHAVAATDAPRHPSTHPGQHRRPVLIPHSHRLPSHHPSNRQTHRQRHRGRNPPIWHPCLLPLRQVGDQTRQLSRILRLHTQVLPETLLLHLRGIH